MEENVVLSHLRRKLSWMLLEAEEDPSSPSQIVSRFRSIEGRMKAMFEKRSEEELLYGIIDALSDCRVFAHQRRSGTRAVSKKVFYLPFLIKLGRRPSEFLFKKNMGRRLDDFERQLTSNNTSTSGSSRPEQDTIIESSSIDPSPPAPVLTIQPTHPIWDPDQIIEFDSQAMEIEDWLMANNKVAAAAATSPSTSTIEEEEEEEEEEEGRGFTAIGIVGGCGCGKSALAQKVFATPGIQEEFSPKIWVCLSNILLDNQRLDPRLTVVIDILEKLGCNVSSLEPAHCGVVRLLEKLRSELMGKRYLIVLDDACRADEWFADLGYRLPGGYPTGEFLSHGLPKGSGGAIIVTSRREDVVTRMVGDKHVIRMEKTGLSHEFCWEIFFDAVERQGKVGLNHEKLEMMKEDVIRNCDGLPLAAKTLANVIPDLL